MAIPFGYFYDKHNHIAIEPGAAAVVQRIFTEFTRPYVRASLSEIAGALNTDEIRTARGGHWHASTVRYVLLNRAYAGEPWPPIVSADLFEAAQQRLAALRPGPPT